MKLIVAGAAALLLTGCVVPGMPMIGMPADLGGVGGTGMTQAEIDSAGANMKLAQANGMAAANRPGDDKLTCDQLQAELMITMRDPKVQAAMGSMGQRAQDQKAKQDAALAGKSQSVTAADTRAPLASAADMTSIMPQMMRGQRINELATAKNCAFLKAPQPQ